MVLEKKTCAYDLLTRWAALEFLSGTLEALDRDVLRVEQGKDSVALHGLLNTVLTYNVSFPSADINLILWVHV